MDMSMRVMQQINVSTSLSLVRFLGVSLNGVLGSLDMCVASVLVLFLSFISGSKHTISTLSRRLAILLILEKLKPLIVNATEGDKIVHIRGLMINTGVVSILAVVPPEWKKSQEAQTLINSITYMYSDIFIFLAAWGDMHVALLISCSVASCYIECVKTESPILSSTLQIISMALTSLVFEIITRHVDNQYDTAIVQWLLLFTMAHSVAIPAVHSTEDYMLYRVAGVFQGLIKNDHWLWCGFLFLLVGILKSWIGLKSWATRVVILVTVNVAVSRMILYIKALAAFDTIVTLKTSAIVIQFVMHELSALTFSKR